eukprot:Hpha_TRINITY_DN15207_c2_g3::TRINITY_DN15207_c2_g3_i3::g.67049::m.67049/K01112/PHPT1; phosphohistidine phosphatase
MKRCSVRLCSGPHHWGKGPRKEGGAQKWGKGPVVAALKDGGPDVRATERRPPREAPKCQLYPGDWKYIIVEAKDPATDKAELHVVQGPCRRCDAGDLICDRQCFHKQLADPVVSALPEELKVWWLGGGWIDVSPDYSEAHVYGQSIALGPADHFETQRIIQKAFPDMKVTAEEFCPATGRRPPQPPPSE